jgi:hypothetical protein
MICYKIIIGFIILCWLSACQNADGKSAESERPKINGKMITDPVLQDSFYSNLEKLTQYSISANKRQDTLAFLLLPVQATCPACRKKTIDSIVKYKDRLDEQHFVVITGKGTRSIDGYFKQQEKEMPYSNRIFYDTVGLASNLTSTNPNVYYAVKGKVYRKVSCLPSTIKADLKEFFENL